MRDTRGNLQVGWENLAGMLRHMQFVRRHQRKIKRVALAVDSAVAEVAPSIAGFFTGAEVKKFAFNELDAAVAWAGAASGPAQPTGTAESGAGPTQAQSQH